MKNNKFIILLLVLITCLAVNPAKSIIGIDKKEYKASAEATALGFKSDALYECVLDEYMDWYNPEDDIPPLTKEDLQDFSRLSCPNMGITDATGIEQMTGLEHLSLFKNKLSSIDLSKNTALESIYLSENQLTSIKLPSGSELEELALDKNKLTSIDLSGATGLARITIASNNLEALDLSKNANLISVYAASNKIKTVNLNNDNMALLDLYNNKLSSIDLSKVANLGYLNLSLNNLTTIDLSKVPHLVYLYISSNKLTKLDLSKQIGLRYINGVFNSFDNYNMPNKDLISYMAIDYDWIKDIDFDEYSGLELLDVNYYKVISVVGNQVKKTDILKQLPTGVEAEEVDVLNNDEVNVVCSCMARGDQSVMRAYGMPNDVILNTAGAGAKRTVAYNVASPNSSFLIQTPSKAPYYYEEEPDYVCYQKPITNAIISSEDTNKIQVRSLDFRMDGLPEDVTVHFNAYYDLNFMIDDETIKDENGDTVLTNVPNTAATILSIVVFGIMILGIGVCIVLQATQKKEVRND